MKGLLIVLGTLACVFSLFATVANVLAGGALAAALFGFATGEWFVLTLVQIART